MRENSQNDGIANDSIAIIDDDSQLVRTYELLFRHKRVPVSFVAYDGRIALEKFRVADPRPGIVIVDYRMPYMTGLEIMGEIRKIEPATKIVVISADDSIMQEALSAGANVFLKKPAGMKAIMDSIGPVQVG